jgi:glycerol-3-phosphate acyltransferase PlsY
MSEIFEGARPLHLALVLLATFAIGGIPNAYLITRWVTGEDVTEHGTGNVGAMNVRRTTGSWFWFAIAMVADALKGLLPTGIAALGLIGRFWPGFTPSAKAAAMVAVVGAVLGHNYSVWLALVKRRFVATGKGLATGGGALLAYDWRYFILVLSVGLAIIAVTRVMMAGQVAASVVLPVYAVLTRAQDWPFAVVLGAIVYVRHHQRFVGMLAGREPKLYVEDGQGPKG